MKDILILKPCGFMKNLFCIHEVIFFFLDLFKSFIPHKNDNYLKEHRERLKNF